jgi:hypothetical protein
MEKKTVMTDAQIINAVKQLVDVIQIQTKNNLVEKSRDLRLTKSDLNAIVSITEASINNAFTSSIDSVLKALKR